MNLYYDKILIIYEKINTLENGKSIERKKEKERKKESYIYIYIYIDR